VNYITVDQGGFTAPCCRSVGVVEDILGNSETFK
jgi:hypothetical protein